MGDGFFANLAEGRFTLPRCRRCERWCWPEVERCRDCGGIEFGWSDTAASGVVHTWTRTHHPFSGVRAASLPYLVVLVRLPAAGDVRMLGILRGPARELGIGSPVVGTIEAPAPESHGCSSVTWRLVAAGPGAG